MKKNKTKINEEQNQDFTAIESKFNPFIDKADVVKNQKFVNQFADIEYFRKLNPEELEYITSFVNEYYMGSFNRDLKILLSDKEIVNRYLIIKKNKKEYKNFKQALEDRNRSAPLLKEKRIKSAKLDFNILKKNPTQENVKEYNKKYGSNIEFKLPLKYKEPKLTIKHRLLNEIEEVARIIKQEQNYKRTKIKECVVNRNIYGTVFHDADNLIESFETGRVINSPYQRSEQLLNCEELILKLDYAFDTNQIFNTIEDLFLDILNDLELEFQHKPDCFEIRDFYDYDLALYETKEIPKIILIFRIYNLLKLVRAYYLQYGKDLKKDDTFNKTSTAIYWLKENLFNKKLLLKLNKKEYLKRFSKDLK